MDEWNEDQQLLDAWRQGSKQAGSIIYDRYNTCVIRFFRYRDPERVEDHVQTTFMRLCQGKNRIRDGHRLGAYVRKIAHYVWLETIRSKQSFNPFRDSLVEMQPGLSTQISHSQRCRRFDRALMHLPVNDRTLIESFYVDGMTLKEIALILNMSDSGVRTRKARVIARLKQIVTQLDASGPMLLTSSATDERTVRGVN